MKNQWKKKQRKKPFRSSKRNCHHERADRLLAGGAGMAVDSASDSIITRALKCIVIAQGSMCLIADDGRSTPNERTSGIPLWEASGDGAIAMSASRASTPVTEKAMESVSVEKQKAYSNACNGQTPHTWSQSFASPSKGGAQ